eukprot:g10005.t1
MEENALDQDGKNVIQTDSKAEHATKSTKGSEAEKNSKDKNAGTRSGMFVSAKAKQEDKEEILMGTVLAYMNPTTSALDYFALLSQPYWSDLGLHLT